MPPKSRISRLRENPFRRLLDTINQRTPPSPAFLRSAVRQNIRTTFSRGIRNLHDPSTRKKYFMLDRDPLPFSPTTVRMTQDNGSSYSDLTANSTDGKEGTTVSFAGLDTLVNGDWFVIGYDDWLEGMYFYIPTGEGNANTATLAAHYWNGSAWTALSIADGTASLGRTLNQAGLVSWTPPGLAGSWPKNTIDGVLAYHLRFSVSAALSATVNVAEIIVDRDSTVDDYVLA